MDFFRRLLRIYPGEGRGALICSLLTFLLSLGVSGGVTLADGKFLEEIGSKGLGMAYFLTSITMLCGAMTLLRLLNRISINKVFFTIIGISLTIYGTLTILFYIGDPSWIAPWYALKIAGDFLLLLMFTGVWLFIDYVYPLQHAKRLYGLFTTAFILGMAAGGALVSVAIEPLGLIGLLIVLIGTQVLGLILVLKVRMREVQVEEQPEEEMKIGELIRRILKSRYTIFLLIFNAAIFTVQTVTEFCYMETLETIFSGAGDNEMTRFIGSTRGWIYVADMVFGALLLSRLVKKIGIENISFLPAGSFFLLFLSWPTLTGQLIIAVLGLIATEGVIPCIEDTNFNLLMKAVPRKIKSKLRILNEHFVEPSAMLLASLLLMKFEAKATLIGLGLAIVGLLGAIFIRRHYTKAIYDNLQEEEVRQEKEVLYLDFNEEDDVCLELNRIAIEGSPHRFESILPHLGSESLDVRRAAMGALAKLASPFARRHTRTLIAVLRTAEDRQLRSLCLLALQKMCRVEQVRLLVMTAPYLRPTEEQRMEEILVSMGTRATAFLTTLAQDIHLNEACRLLAAKVLGSIAPKQLRILEHDIDRASLYLLDGNEVGYRSALRLIIHSLGKVKDCDLLYRALLSHDREIHSHAVETLEKVCPPKTFRRLVPLLEYSHHPELLARQVKLRKLTPSSLGIVGMSARLNGPVPVGDAGNP